MKPYDKPVIRDYGALADITAGILNNAPVREDIGVKSNNVDIGGAKG